MHADEVGPSFGESLNVAFGLLHHQMNVQRQFARAAHSSHEVRTTRQVGNEPAIHHVDMDCVRTSGRNGLDYFAEFEEISSENGRGDTHWSLHATDRIQHPGSLCHYHR